MKLIPSLPLPHRIRQVEVYFFCQLVAVRTGTGWFIDGGGVLELEGEVLEEAIDDGAKEIGVKTIGDAVDGGNWFRVVLGFCLIVCGLGAIGLKFV